MKLYILPIAALAFTSPATAQYYEADRGAQMNREYEMDIQRRQMEQKLREQKYEMDRLQQDLDRARHTGPGGWLR